MIRLNLYKVYYGMHYAEVIIENYDTYFMIQLSFDVVLYKCYVGTLSISIV